MFHDKGLAPTHLRDSLRSVTVPYHTMIRQLVAHRALLVQMIKRDVLLRYRGAMFGVAWIFLSPLLLLGIFAFVFGQIFQARWPDQPEGWPFWLTLYSGLIVFNVFGEAVSRAPAAVRSNPAYVKKIIFPVELLPLVPVGSSLIHAGFNLLILACALVWTGHLGPGILWLPILLLPVLFLSIGLAWFLGAWGFSLRI